MPMRFIIERSLSKMKYLTFILGLCGQNTNFDTLLTTGETFVVHYIDVMILQT